VTTVFDRLGARGYGIIAQETIDVAASTLLRSIRNGCEHMFCHEEQAA